MSDLVRQVTSEAQIPGTGIGIFVQRVSSPSVTRGRTRQTVGIICAAPWGDAETWYEPDSITDLIERYVPFGWSASALADALGLPWGRIKFWNARGSGAAAATVTLDDASAGDSLTIAAKKTGTNGNRIKYAVTANADTATSRDVRIYVEAPDGTIIYDETYLAVQVSNGDVTDPGDQFVTLSKASGATGPAAATSGTLSGGSEGTLAASDYVDAMNAALAADSGIDILVCVGVASGTVAALRTAIMTWAGSAGAESKIAILPTPVAEARATAITNIASFRARNLRACYPRVRRSFTYSHRGYSTSLTATVDGAATLACLLQLAGPTNAAFQSEAARIGSSALASILGLEAGYDVITKDNHDSLMAAGIMSWYRSASYGRYLPYSGVTTFLVGGTPVRDHEERYFQYVAEAIANTAEAFIGKPLDVNLSNNTLGPNTAALRTAVVAFLQDELNAGRVIAGKNPDGSSSPAYVFDAFGAATPTNLASGRWDVNVGYRQTPNAEMIVLRFTGGTSVTINRLQ